MTGRGHRWTGVGAAFMAAALARAFHLPELVAAAVAAGSTTLPDWVEMPFYRRDAKTGMRVRVGALIPHRTITHWPPLWLGVIYWGVHAGGFVGSMAIGAAIGAIVHILGDAPNPMGIPWLVPTKRLKLGKKGWWRSGEHEIMMTLSFATAGFVSWQLVSMWNMS
ncbi:single-stranded DNA exonuclease [Novimethylophilus kurashikiensis]|uniref:Single-stranded DNA exonuclease n=1 Tax=Novimethylophilus kurashikiensis TaxID=1825523 RepID=A0A2R5F805_9PROT|nr:metal-dependent hydrolase [Novimethylophilus kurashikiensis]GBG14372.1 single-stranded DNA exonuclease [Novimethylophilus kurashikiensis]